MTIMHADLNSFFASCAIADSGGKYNRDMPIVVCGDPRKRHGIVLAATYPVKKLGVHAGMPVMDAYMLCPDAIFVPPDYKRYTEYSERFMRVMRSFSPNIMSYGMDEAYLDYSGCEKLFGPPATAAHLLRERVRRETGLTISVGVGDNPLMAKMGSDYKKPDAVTVLDERLWRERIWPLPVGRLMFIGGSTESRLERCGIRSIGDLAHMSPAVLRDYFGNAAGRSMWEHANGIDQSRITNVEAPQKSVSCSSTLEHDAVGEREVSDALLRQVEKAAYRMREKGMLAQLVGVHIRFKDLSHEGRQLMLRDATNVTGEIYDAARQILHGMYSGGAVRQVGVALGRLSEGGEQLSLFTPEKHIRMGELDAAIDSLRLRFGFDSVRRLSTARFNYSAKDDFKPFTRAKGA